MTLKEFQKLIKWCKKQGLKSAKFADFEFSIPDAPQKIQKTTKKSIVSDKIEGLTTDESAKMPSDGDLLYWSTDSFDQITQTRKDPNPRM